MSEIGEPLTIEQALGRALAMITTDDDSRANTPERERFLMKYRAVDGAISEITRLRAALADAHTVGFAAGVEAAAVVIRKSCPQCRGTGQRDSGGTYPWGEGIFLACDCCDDIHALTPPDSTAAAARVLLADLDKNPIHHPDARDRQQLVNDAIGRDVEAWLGYINILRAIAGDTPWPSGSQ